jgi:hypothetical protein
LGLIYAQVVIPDYLNGDCAPESALGGVRAIENLSLIYSDDTIIHFREISAFPIGSKTTAQTRPDLPSTKSLQL